MKQQQLHTKPKQFYTSPLISLIECEVSSSLLANFSYEGEVDHFLDGDALDDGNM